MKPGIGRSLSEADSGAYRSPEAWPIREAGPRDQAKPFLGLHSLVWQLTVLTSNTPQPHMARLRVNSVKALYVDGRSPSVHPQLLLPSF